MSISFENTASYFAAANSFTGFRSHFDKVFAPEEYERIYILKGGPGTGKSTLMRRIAEIMLKRNCDVIRIYCSSDPCSLDGVIIKNSDKKIAIIDGTAPHTYDPQYPGAVECIVNLGDSFDKCGLSRHKDRIIYLSKEKAKAYKQAYAYLGTCGELYDRIWGKIEKINIISEAELLSDKIMEYELFSEKYEKTIDDYWLGGFCKDGYVRLNIPCFEKEYISVIGDGFTEQIVLNILFERLNNANVINLIARSALTPKSTDVIITGSCIISTDNVGCTVIDTSVLARFLDEEYKIIRAAYENILGLAKKYMKTASDIHFDLESIYTSHVDFGYHNDIAGILESEISDILF